MLYGNDMVWKTKTQNTKKGYMTKRQHTPQKHNVHDPDGTRKTSTSLDVQKPKKLRAELKKYKQVPRSMNFQKPSSDHPFSSPIVSSVSISLRFSIPAKIPRSFLFPDG